MAMKLPFLCLLLLLPLTLSGAQEQKCLQSASSCDRCIEAGPECAWCGAPNAAVRCHTLQGLLEAGCEESHVYNPQGNVAFLLNEPSTEPVPSKTVFLQPQEVSINMRPGKTESFLLNVTVPTDRSVRELSLEQSWPKSGIKASLESKLHGNPMLVQVNVEAPQCPSRKENMTGPWIIRIASRHSLLRVKINLNLQCHCDCSLQREERSPTCDSKGALVCGHCECDDAYEGERCQTDVDPFFVHGDDYCRPDSKAPLCSDHGTCVMGGCECSKRIDPNERYSGQYCECNNFMCPSSNNRLCGGNGKCECGKCICNDGWGGEGCDCSTDVSNCLAKNGEICNGRGSCECGACHCTDVKFQGPTCEICPTCPGVCTQMSSCVECRAYGIGDMMDRCETDCNYFNMTTVATVNDLPGPEEFRVHCKERNKDDCWYYFTYKKTPNEKHVTVVQKRQCPRSGWFDFF